MSAASALHREALTSGGLEVLDLARAADEEGFYLAGGTALAHSSVTGEAWNSTVTVVSSLWSVKDRSTSELMPRFYENLWLEKKGRAEALRNAQLEMLARNRATEGDALPWTWGAFVLSGEWR